MKRIPPEAFEFYVAQGPGRSYRLVAEHYGVTKRAVTKCAVRENWHARLVKIEEESRAKSDKRAADTLGEMNERHLKIARALQGKAIDSLRVMPLDSAKDIIRALEVGVRQERLVLGEPTERTANLEETIRGEYERWMEVNDKGGGDA